MITVCLCHGIAAPDCPNIQRQQLRGSQRESAIEAVSKLEEMGYVWDGQKWSDSPTKREG